MICTDYDMTTPPFGAADDDLTSVGKDFRMDQNSEKLIEEIRDLALQYNVNYFG